MCPPSPHAHCLCICKGLQYLLHPEWPKSPHACMRASTQISKALLGDDQRLKLPRFLEEEKDPEQTKQDLIDKIAQVNMAYRHSCDAHSQPPHISSTHAATT